MTSLSADTREPVQMEVPARRRVRGVTLDAATTRRLLAWVDQGLVSLGNFISTLVIARALPPAAFGIYAVMFALVLVLNTFHAALVLFPLSIRGPAMDGVALRESTSAALLGTLVLAGPLALVAAAAVWSTGRPTLLPCVAAAFVCWELQETTRTAFLTHFRQRDALLGDSVSYLGQATLLLVLSRRGMLSPESAFLTIAFTSAVAFLIQAVQLRIARVHAARWSAFVGDARTFGAWGVPARIGTLLSIQAFPWVLFYTHGAASAAVFQILASAVAFTNPVMIGTANLVTATIARTQDPQRFPLALRHALHGWAVIFPMLAVVTLFPSATLRLIYGAHTAYAQHAHLLWMMAVAFGAESVIMQATAVIGGSGLTRPLFMVQATGLAVALVFGLPFAAYGGVPAALAGFIAVQMGRSVLALRIWSRLAAGQRLQAAGGL